MAVALIAIGPKDLPVAIRTVTGLMKKARGMAAEFQGHVDEMMREANLAEVKSELGKIRNFDFRGAVEKEIDPDGSLMTAFPARSTAPQGRVFVRPPPEAAPEEPVESPAFIPPADARRRAVPAFIPPGTRRWS